MPDPGTYVEKPDDFCYFQYGTAAPILELLLTSTLYPIEVIEGMDITPSIQDGAMFPIYDDAMDFTFSLVDANLVAILQSTGPYDDAMDFNFSLVDANLSSILASTGPYDDAMDFNFSLVDATLNDLLIFGFMPDEGLDFVVSLVSGSMTGFTGRWIRATNDDVTTPPATFWNMNTIQTLLRINWIDDDSVDRREELKFPNETSIHIQDKVSSDQWLEVVMDNATTWVEGTDWTEYTVTFVSQGPNGQPGVGNGCDITVTLP
jgi:hypothetical protein